ncbi:DUF6422 family protein [Streptomyces toxytricini]|uniref:DUF6422 family protein n=1 Tax=Streptomyces toxytricini TaxID=67369 RepID=A0ABW8EQZ0_STRT5
MRSRRRRRGRTRPPYEQLTGDRLEALQKAALLVIGAREEAATLLTRARVADSSDGVFWSPCRRCVCPQYQGRDERSCERDSCRYTGAQQRY